MSAEVVYLQLFLHVMLIVFLGVEMGKGGVYLQSPARLPTSLLLQSHLVWRSISILINKSVTHGLDCSLEGQHQRGFKSCKECVCFKACPIFYEVQREWEYGQCNQVHNWEVCVHFMEGRVVLLHKMTNLAVVNFADLCR